MNQQPYKHSFKTQSAENLSLAVYNSGIEQCKPLWGWGPAMRDHFLIHYVVQGKGTLTRKNESFPVYGGQAFIVFPSEIVSYVADEADPWIYYWVGFNGIEAEHLVGLTDFSKINPVIDLSGEEGLVELLLNIYNARGNRMEQEAEMTGYLFIFLSRLIKIARKTAPLQSDGFAYIQKALRFIQYNYSESLSIDRVATHVGISRSHLYRIFMAHLKVSPNEYISQFRMKVACSLLRKPDLSVGEIASSVGISDPLYFSRLFKKHKGISPSKYAAQIGKNENNF